MSRRILSIVFAALALVGLNLVALAAPNGTPDEAKAMVEKAVKLIQSEGKDKAFQAFNDPAGSFVDRDLYVFVLSMEGVTVAHGANKALIGKNLSNLKDADGKPLIKEMVAVANSTGSGWVDYKWANPSTKKVEPKSSFVQKVGDVIVGVGAYKS